MSFVEPTQYCKRRKIDCQIFEWFRKQVSYRDLFAETELVTIPKLGNLAAYANRGNGTIKAITAGEVKTMFESHPASEEFCKGWNTIVRLGLYQRPNYILKPMVCS
ncbi:MAG: hypothetical protein IPI46_11685 [Bacteroidetes bacterium]|nr:hypothetical protein [Bacteroidota bacterium]